MKNKGIKKTFGIINSNNISSRNDDWMWRKKD